MLAEAVAAIVIWAVPPAPSPMPRVHIADCPGLASGVSCYVGDGRDFNDVYLSWPPAENPYTYEHELGHAYDQLQLDDGERRRISAVMGWNVWRRQAFADFYAGCRIVLDPRGQVGQVIYRGRGIRAVAARCRLIARAGRA